MNFTKGGRLESVELYPCTLQQHAFHPQCGIPVRVVEETTMDILETIPRTYGSRLDRSPDYE